MSLQRDLLTSVRDYITLFLETGQWPNVALHLDQVGVKPLTEREIKKKVVRLFERHGVSLTDVGPEFIELVRWVERRYG